MSNDNLSEETIKTKEEIKAFLHKHKAFYGPIRVQAAISHDKNGWKVIVAKVIALHKSQKHVDEILDYGDFILIDVGLTSGEFIELLDEMVTHGRLRIRNGPQILVEGNFSDKVDFRPSNDHVFQTSWPTYLYTFNLTSRGTTPSNPLCALDKPLFPDGDMAIRSKMGREIANRLGHIFIFLPDYRAKIEEVRIGSKEITLKISSREASLEEILGKIYCEGDVENIVQSDVNFDDNDSVTVSIGFTPRYLYTCLLLRDTGEQLDFRKINLYWPAPTLPKGVVLEMKSEDIRQLILQGENERVEFKKSVTEDIVKTIVAFSNKEGGIILVGVDDEGNVVGVSEEAKLEEKIINTIGGRCEPTIEPEFERHVLDEKMLLLVKVRSGEDKPYIIRGKGPYIRVGSTNRPTTRYELDELYKNKFRSPLYSFS